MHLSCQIVVNKFASTLTEIYVDFFVSVGSINGLNGLNGLANNLNGLDQQMSKFFVDFCKNGHTKTDVFGGTTQNGLTNLNGLPPQNGKCLLLILSLPSFVFQLDYFFTHLFQSIKVLKVSECKNES